jgi:hypothetical protein
VCVVHTSMILKSNTLITSIIEHISMCLFSILYLLCELCFQIFWHLKISLFVIYWVFRVCYIIWIPFLFLIKIFFTVAQGGCMLWHPQKFLQCIPLPSIPGIISKGIIFSFTYLCILYLHSIHPPTPFPQFLPPPTGTNSGYHFFISYVFARNFPHFLDRLFSWKYGVWTQNFMLASYTFYHLSCTQALDYLVNIIFFNQCFALLVPGIEPRVLCKLGKYTSIEIHP